jgi:hypothetical protein
MDARRNLCELPKKSKLQQAGRGSSRTPDGLQARRRPGVPA